MLYKLVVPRFVLQNEINMDLLIEMSDFPMVEALLLLLLPMENIKNINWSNKLIMGYYEKFQKLKYKKEAEDFIGFILNDNFRTDILEDGNLAHFHIQLEKIKKNLLEIYFSSIKEDNDLSNNNEFIGDYNTLLTKYFLQMRRLRLVIQPDIQMTTSKHPKTTIKYLKSIGFWIDDFNNRERKYFKSVGRLDEFPDEKEDKNAYLLAEKMIRELILKDYKEKYPR